MKKNPKHILKVRFGDKKIVHIDIGNTVFWKSVDSGHNVEFIKGAIPEGVEKFKSALSQDTKYTFSWK